MHRLDENFYLRKCYFQREQVPTQTVMRKKMCSNLAQVYFDSMSARLKALAGLEPALDGGGGNWFMPPEELLKGRAVKKPCPRECLSKLGHKGIELITEKLFEDHKKSLQQEMKDALDQNDREWMKTIDEELARLRAATERQLARENTEKIIAAFKEFELMYKSSLNNLESIMMDATVKEIEKVREAAYAEMVEKYKVALKDQAIMLYDRHTKRLARDQKRAKDRFVDEVQRLSTAMTRTAHDLKVDKHIAVQRLRHLLECQKLACQMYVALKEQQDCQNEIDKRKHEQEKKTKLLKDEIALQTLEINRLREKEKVREEFNAIWRRKVCHIVKKLQMFIKYCLRTVPEHAEFFINMETLMLLQLGESYDSVGEGSSVFEQTESESGRKFNTPVPHLRPFILLGDVGRKPVIDETLCPPSRGSSVAHMPVVLINKHCLYAACDQMEHLKDTMSEYIQGRVEYDIGSDREHPCARPVSVTPSQRLQDLQLQGSLMQILQQEEAAIRDVPVECCLCKLPFCFCEPPKTTEPSVTSASVSEIKIPSITILRRSQELMHEREPKIESYMQYVKPTKCECPKIAKKHLKEHLPPYMRMTSRYAQPVIPNYERCPVETIKILVERSRNRPPPPPVEDLEAKTKDVAVQISDIEFDTLCTCFSEDELRKLCREIRHGIKATEAKQQNFEVVEAAFSPVPSYSSKKLASFAMDNAWTLRRMVHKSPELEEIFMKEDCDDLPPKKTCADTRDAF
ncbi:hypothetical protein JYU34_014631 [Plutella xylostella]|uniref:Uncharacterized protein n=1 Tax=Plutella xylostella TaxID=51655 RepID=A0ABQ7Q8T5_PLUXY|nr:hypothetical protein JYU34_014631 [Plutella xylostella]